MQLVLGSSSPYKQALLRKAGYTFIVDPADVAEDSFLQATVVETVRVLAEVKAKALLPKYLSTETVIITADVLGEFNHEHLGKPGSLELARQWLQSYSGNTVKIWCGTSIAYAQTGIIHTDVRCAEIFFKKISSTQIDDYLSKDYYCSISSPLHKSGAIGIEEAERLDWVETISGEYAAIIGLSLQFIQSELQNQL